MKSDGNRLKFTKNAKTHQPIIVVKRGGPPKHRFLSQSLESTNITLHSKLYDYVKDLERRACPGL